MLYNSMALMCGSALVYARHEALTFCTCHMCVSRLQDVCNNNASFDLAGEQVLNAIAEMEQAQTIIKVCIDSSTERTV